MEHVFYVSEDFNYSKSFQKIHAFQIQTERAGDSEMTSCKGGK